MARTVQEYEDGVRGGHYPDGLNVTPESAIVGIDVNSMVGSGVSVFADFGDAVCWFWRVCEDHWAVGNKNAWIPDEQVSIRLREGRSRFRALLARFVTDGYTRDMGQELHDIVFDVLGGWAVGGYGVSGVSVLPGDLDKELEGWWGDPDADEYFADMAAAGTPVPQFDLSNPEHFAKLKERLEMLAEG